MLRLTIRFPLGVYHAQAATAFDDAEWPPSPLRLVGALLAAAHERQTDDLAADRAVIQRLCNAPPPNIVAPEATPTVRSPTRWAPRNYFSGSRGRTPAPVSKVGAVVGDRAVHMVWPEVELENEALQRLRALATEVTFVGTTRSPAIVDAGTDPVDHLAIDSWQPSTDADGEAASLVRVPTATTLEAFDRRQQARHSTTKKVEPAGHVPGIWIGREIPYVHTTRQRVTPHDAHWWGEWLVLRIDREASEIAPKVAGAYAVARALRVALLGAYGKEGEPGEAPPILRGRGDEPHCALLALPNVWGEHADGRLLGMAVVLPHRQRVDNVAAQRDRLLAGLRRLVSNQPEAPRRYLQVPRSGRIWLETADARSARLVTLRPSTYLGTSSTWVSVTPLVHSRWQKRGDDSLLEQVALDCEHVGLPRPATVERLRTSPLPGGPDGRVATRGIPDEWLRSLKGPTGHVRITFPSPVRGPVLLGRARHFGLGLCVPAKP